MHRIMVVRCLSPLLPFLGLMEISFQASEEIADATTRMAEWISVNGMWKFVIDPLKVECWIVTDEDWPSCAEITKPFFKPRHDINDIKFFIICEYRQCR